jgi:hypothetical protein
MTGLFTQDKGERATLADVLDTINGPFFGPLMAQRAPTE